MKARTTPRFNIQLDDRAPLPRLLLEKIKQLLHWTSRRWAVSRERRQLATLSPYMLKDLGLSESDRIREAGKHFWE
ncbi:DUF1127 domain-containing protein [Hahella ganghwensis]|uniref:DUF1127 domain-containing protein n=1 Tax=Hahella ganghwensis TaxID=286420 RepID=UPI000370FB6B|nr:DUF1127 domain-containing protein [Hahella ganghwensis]